MLTRKGLRKGDEHPAYAPVGVWYLLPMLACGSPSMSTMTCTVVELSLRSLVEA